MRKSNRLIAVLKAKGLQIERAYLYGSYAKGHARPDSDIDIAIVSKDLTGDWLDDYCRLTRIADEVDPRIEVISFLPQDFRDENPLVWEIKSFGIPLTGHRHLHRASKPRRKPRPRAKRR
ncbi:MAG: nucleotidyltransferase domain-containing protein [Anaerolineae bacterium]|nr:nucleotidyltransferase domain-containing protein [Anaerolineae bacterium]